MPRASSPDRRTAQSSGPRYPSARTGRRGPPQLRVLVAAVNGAARLARIAARKVDSAARARHEVALERRLRPFGLPGSGTERAPDEPHDEHHDEDEDQHATHRAIIL